MYQTILEALFRINNRTTAEEQTSYLLGLKPVARALWKAYKPPTGRPVVVSYSDVATQAVYMIRYFPHSLRNVSAVLGDLQGKVALPFFPDFRSVVFFGPGLCARAAPLLWF